MYLNRALWYFLNKYYSLIFSSLSVALNWEQHLNKFSHLQITHCYICTIFAGKLENHVDENQAQGTQKTILSSMWDFKPQSLALLLNALITKQLDKILSQVKPEFNLVCFTIITFLLPPVYVHRRQVNSGLS